MGYFPVCAVTIFFTDSGGGVVPGIIKKNLITIELQPLSKRSLNRSFYSPRRHEGHEDKRKLRVFVVIF